LQEKEILEYLDAWNDVEENKNKIIYTDASTILTSTLGEIVNIVQIVLIAFSSVSLVVSSIMIGIITYVSVIERTKEIGVLRAVGARKKDVSRVFNAETLIIGFVAGLLGVVITYLLCLALVNPIVNSLANGSVHNIAALNPLHAIIMVIVSMVLTLIGGSIPAKIASKKDPVEALRSE
jgi:putative ABC transport system permease protein